MLLTILGPRVQAQELDQLGRFEISEFALSPRLRLQEPGQGGFELSQSWIGFEWTRDELVRGVLKLGSSDLNAPAIWNSPEVRPSFGVNEAWMEGRSSYGDMRAGLLTIAQSFEGLSPEWSSVLPETRARRKSWFIKRDFGLQLRWLAKPWETSITVHNGESGENKDGQYWTTAHWRYQSSGGTGMLITGSIGQTKPESTQTSEAGLPVNGFVFDRTDKAKTRQGSVALYRQQRRNLLLLEAGRGEILQQEEKNSFFWGHFDAVWNWGSDASLLFRYEMNQPNQKDSASTIRSPGLGFSYSSKDNLQSITAFYSRVEEDPQVPSDEFWLIFRIHSVFAR